MKLTEAINALKPSSQADGLLALLQAEAANDASVTKHPPADPADEVIYDSLHLDDLDDVLNPKPVGQWVFNDAPDWVKSASFDNNGRVTWHDVPKDKLRQVMDDFWIGKKQGGKLLNTNYFVDDGNHLPIDRQPIDDVAYLDERQDFESQALDSHETSGVNFDAVFIRNLCDVLIWRMRDNKRFSSSALKIKSEDLQMWDLVKGSYIDNGDYEYGVVVQTMNSTVADKNYLSMIVLQLYPPVESPCLKQRGDISIVRFEDNKSYRTITADELSEFKQALEASNG